MQQPTEIDELEMRPLAKSTEPQRIGRMAIEHRHQDHVGMPLNRGMERVVDLLPKDNGRISTEIQGIQVQRSPSGPRGVIQAIQIIAPSQQIGEEPAGLGLLMVRVADEQQARFHAPSVRRLRTAAARPVDPGEPAVIEAKKPVMIGTRWIPRNCSPATRTKLS